MCVLSCVKGPVLFCFKRRVLMWVEQQLKFGFCLMTLKVKGKNVKSVKNFKLLEKASGKGFLSKRGQLLSLPTMSKTKKCSAIHYRAYITVFRPNETVTMSFERDLVFYEMRWCRLHFWYFCAFKVNNYIHKSKLHYYVLICLLPPNTIYCRCVLNLVSNEHNHLFFKLTN